MVMMMILIITPHPLLCSIKNTESRPLWNTADYYKCAVLQGKTSRCLRRLLICLTNIKDGIEKFLITYCCFFFGKVPGISVF